jgi:hypothetical protein
LIQELLPQLGWESVINRFNSIKVWLLRVFDEFLWGVGERDGFLNHGLSKILNPEDSGELVSKRTKP